MWSVDDASQSCMHLQSALLIVLQILSGRQVPSPSLSISLCVCVCLSACVSLLVKCKSMSTLASNQCHATARRRKESQRLDPLSVRKSDIEATQQRCDSANRASERVSRI